MASVLPERRSVNGRAYHSDAGLQAILAHEAHAFNHSQTPN